MGSVQSIPFRRQKKQHGRTGGRSSWCPRWSRDGGIIAVVAPVWGAGAGRHGCVTGPLPNHIPFGW